MRPPARNRRRSEGLVRTCCHNPPSGEEMTPEGPLQTGFRTKHLLRRPFLAGGAFFSAATTP